MELQKDGRLWSPQLCHVFTFYSLVIFGSHGFRKKSMPNKADAIQVTRACIMPYFRSLNDLAQGTAFGSEWEDSQISLYDAAKTRTFLCEFHYDTISRSVTISPKYFPCSVWSLSHFAVRKPKKKIYFAWFYPIHYFCLRFLFCSEVVDLCGFFFLV